MPILRQISIILGDDTPLSMAKSVGIGIMGMCDALADIKPDCLIVYGDRGEMLAGTIAAAHANIPIIHISGGDISGSIDDSIRNAISKFAHIHLAISEDGAANLKKMGEDEKRIFIVGEPSLDIIHNFSPVDPNLLAKKFNLDLSRPIILATQHPVSNEAEFSGQQMRETIEALLEIGAQTIISYPNSDAGNKVIIKVIEEYKDHPLFRFSRNLPHEVYLSLMKISSVMVGNSSSGIIEAPSFKLPVINIGTRQINRLRASNVIDVGYNKKEIVEKIKFVMTDIKFKKNLKLCVNPYGDGYSSEKIFQIIKNLDVTGNLTSKWLN
jgi:UDP-N-acetylglucosamine 2-epimerase (non-hydrolysing)/GDP/UDP-N,N'-diacetylbacillosamine 2-epimerase (hydrolysing)